MAAAASSSSVVSLLLLSVILLFSGPPRCTCSPHPRGGDERSHHVVSTRTLFPDDVCSPSKGFNHTLLEVVHRDGPCSPTHGRRGLSTPSPAQTLLLDESRAQSLSSRCRRPAPPSQQPIAREAHVSTLPSTVPARSGRPLGTGNYLVTVGFGTPRKDFSVVLDTGSDLTWVQCWPCSNCYPQQEPVFDPARSSSYHNISCSSDECIAIETATRYSPLCSASNCIYTMLYGDNSYSVGEYARETLSLASTDVFPGFRFGCGGKNRGLYGRAAGILGLARGPVSLVSQASDKYGRVFSYCLSSTTSSTGYLTMGAGEPSPVVVKYTPMLTDPFLPSFYFLNLVGISVGGRQLPLPAGVLQSSGTLIDSGTIITRLPQAAYAALRSAFRKLMSGYPAAPSLSILDTCYDLSGSNGTVSVPKVSLVFRGGVALDVHPSGLLYVANVSHACLAFAGEADPRFPTIVGNMQQKTYKVVYDASREVIGFGAGGCS